MKVFDRSPRDRTIRLQGHTFTLSKAKAYLGRLIEKASRGESVYIVRGQDRFILQQVFPIAPIPIRHPGFFDHAYTREEIEEQNDLAKGCVVPSPLDIE